MEEQTSRLRADFNGLFGSVLCLSHGESSLDEHGQAVPLHEGMRVTVFDEDADADGARDDLIASGIVARAPEWLTHDGSRWVLQIDELGVRHESDQAHG
jgi:hypothetical protein